MVMMLLTNIFPNDVVNIILDKIEVSFKCEDRIIRDWIIEDCYEDYDICTFCNEENEINTYVYHTCHNNKKEECNKHTVCVECSDKIFNFSSSPNGDCHIVANINNINYRKGLTIGTNYFINGNKCTKKKYDKIMNDY